MARSTEQHEKAQAKVTDELSDAELEQAVGGMNWTRGTVNSDVVDARGGSGVLFGIRWTKDINGNLSSATPL